MINRYVTRRKAYELKNYSVYFGIAAYMSMIITGDIIFGAAGKLIAETLRIPYFLHTNARDMAWLSAFFITASIIAIIGRLL